MISTKPSTGSIRSSVIRKSIATLLGGVLIGAAAPSVRAASADWTGAADGMWANTNNWSGLPVVVPGTGDIATFNASSANTTIDLGGGVSIFSVWFDPPTVSYTIGAGGAGNQTLSLNDGGAIDFLPGVGAPQLFNANVSLSSAASARAFFINPSPVSLDINGNVIANVASGNGLLAVAVTNDSGLVSINGAVTKPGAGNNALLKTGAGMLTLASNSTWSGNAAIGYVPTSVGYPMVVREGTLRINGGSNVVNGELVIGGVVANGGAGQDAKIQVDAGVLNVTSWLSVGRGNGVGGVSSDLVVASNAVVTTVNLSAGYNGGTNINKPKGSITLNNNATMRVSAGDACFFSESDDANFTMNVNDSASFRVSGIFRIARDNATATVNLNGGSISVGNDVWLGNNLNTATRGGATVTVNSGATLNAAALRVAYSGTQSNNSSLTINGGTVNISNVLEVVRWDTLSGTLTLNSGAIRMLNNSPIFYAERNNSGTRTFNHNGGTVTFYSDAGTNVGGTGYLDLDIENATHSSGTSIYNLNGGTLTVPEIRKTETAVSTNIFNFNGGTLKATTNNANYIRGFIALNIQSGGAIIDSAGFNIGTTNNLTDNSSGGSLIKKSGGTLTLAGLSTQGSVTVEGGELGFSVPSSSCNNLTLSNGVTNSLNKTDGSGNMNVFGTYTLNNNVLNMNFGAASGFPDHFILATTLSASGVTTINITGSGLGLGVKPLIQFGTGPAGVANFALGTLPAGVSGTLTNTGNAIALNITTSGKSLSWLGYDTTSFALLPNWTIGGSTNWTDLIGLTNAQYAVGDNVTFGDAHFGNGATNVILNTAVIPSSMAVNSFSYDYTITGSGSIGGGLTLVKSNAASLTLGTSNSYTGGTIIGGGTLIISNNNALGNTAGNVTLGNATLRLAADVTSARAINITANSTISTATNTSSTLNGLISGTGGITKAGNGTLTVTNYNATSGNLLINTGTMVFGGTVKPGTDILIADGSGSGTVNQTTGVAGTGVNNWAVVGRNGSAVGVFNLSGSSSFSSARLIVGQNTATGTVTMVSGTVLSNNFSGNWWENYSLGFGIDNNGLGTLNMSGGTIKASRVWVGGWGGKGDWNQTGGTADITGNYWVGVMQDNDAAQPNGSIGTALISNATVNAGNVMVGRGGVDNGATQSIPNSRVKGDMTVANGGVVNSENDLQVGYSGLGSWGSYGMLNINSGGIVNVGSTNERWMVIGRYDTIPGTVNVNSGGTLNLNGGTDLVPGPNGNSATRLINVNGGSILGTLSDGVHSESYVDFGYSSAGTNILTIQSNGTVAVKAVFGGGNSTTIVNFDNGTLRAITNDPGFLNLFSATNAVNILAGGAKIDSAGFNVTIPYSGMAGVGGLTKIGAGALYLNGTNAYTGQTTVSNGTLGGTGVIVGPVVFNSGTTLSPGASIGTLTISNRLNFAGGVLAEVNNTNAQTSDLTVVTGGITNTGSGTVTVTNLGPALAVGNTFQLFSTNVVNGGSLTISGPAGVTWTNELATLGQIRVLTAGSTPSPTLLTNSYNGTNLTLSWPAGQGWRLQQQITNRTVGLTTNWTAITDSSVNTTNITPNKTNGTVFYRLIYP